MDLPPFRDSEIKALAVPTPDRMASVEYTFSEFFEPPYGSGRDGEFLGCSDNKTLFLLYASNSTDPAWRGEMPTRRCYVVLSLVAKFSGALPEEHARNRQHEQEMLTEATINVLLKSHSDFKDPIFCEGTANFYTYTRCSGQYARKFFIGNNWLGYNSASMIEQYVVVSHQDTVLDEDDDLQLSPSPLQLPPPPRQSLSHSVSSLFPSSPRQSLSHSVSSLFPLSPLQSLFPENAPAVQPVFHSEICDLGNLDVPRKRKEEKAIPEVFLFTACSNENCLYQVMCFDPVLGYSPTLQEFLLERRNFTAAQIKPHLRCIYAQVFARLAWLNFAFLDFEHGNLSAESVRLIGRRRREDAPKYDLLRIELFDERTRILQVLLVPLCLTEGRYLQLQNFQRASALVPVAGGQPLKVESTRAERDELMCRRWYRELPFGDDVARDSDLLRFEQELLLATAKTRDRWFRYLTTSPFFSELRVRNVDATTEALPPIFALANITPQVAQSLRTATLRIELPRDQNHTPVIYRQNATMPINCAIAASLSDDNRRVGLVLSAPHSFCDVPVHYRICDRLAGGMFDSLVDASKFYTDSVEVVLAKKNTDTLRQVLDLNRPEARNNSDFRAHLSKALSSVASTHARSVLIDVHSMPRGAFSCADAWGPGAKCNTDVVILTTLNIQIFTELISDLAYEGVSATVLPAHPLVNDILAEAASNRVSLYFILEVAEDLASAKLSVIAKVLLSWLSKK